jgi:DNA-binding response OmpR family regulator
MARDYRRMSPVGDRSLRRKIEEIKRQKIVGRKVVQLNDFRDLKRGQDSRTVLVVDDDEIMRNAMKRILEPHGFNVLLAEDGVEFAKILETTPLDLILLDINLPWVDGYELCRLVKENSSLRDVPLLLVSARKSDDDIRKGFEAGATDFITKPFDVDVITLAIQKALLKSS